MSDRTTKLTKRAIDILKPGPERTIIWDSEIKGFGIRVETSGTKTFLLRYRSGGRKRFYTLGRYGALTPEEARKAARAAMGAVARGEDPASARTAARGAPTIREIADRYLTEQVEAKRKSSTSLNYRGIIANHLLPKYGSLKAADLTPDDVGKLHYNLRDTPYQANRLLAVLSAMFVWAGKKGIIPKGHNPANDVDRFREHPREVYLGPNDLERLGNALRELEASGRLAPSAAAAIRLLVLTGARLREILHLRWEQVDFERGLLRLPESKTGAKAIILNTPALAILAEIDRTGEYVIAGDRPDAPRSDLKKPWSAIKNRAGLDGVRLHDLRHTFASHGADASLSLPIIGKLLGHTQSVTTQRYAHLGTDPLRKASERIGTSISGAMDP